MKELILTIQRRVSRDAVKSQNKKQIFFLSIKKNQYRNKTTTLQQEEIGSTWSDVKCSKSSFSQQSGPEVGVMLERGLHSPFTVQEVNRGPENEIS